MFLSGSEEIEEGIGEGAGQFYVGEMIGQKDVANLTMYIDDFIWIPDILDKLVVKHHVTQEEVEEIFFNRPRYRFVESGYRRGEDVYSATGQTDAGRYLIVLFIHKPTNMALILSARDLDKKERRTHERK